MSHDNNLVENVTVEITNSLPFAFSRAEMKTSSADNWSYIGDIQVGKNSFTIQGPLDDTYVLVQARAINGQWAIMRLEKRAPNHIIAMLSEDREGALSSHPSVIPVVAFSMKKNLFIENYASWAPVRYKYSWEATVSLVVVESYYTLDIKIDSDPTLSYHGADSSDGFFHVNSQKAIFFSYYAAIDLIGLVADYSVVRGIPYPLWTIDFTSTTDVHVAHAVGMNIIRYGIDNTGEGHFYRD